MNCVVVDEQNPATPVSKPENRQAQKRISQTLIAERGHAARLVARAQQARAERRAHEDRDQPQRAIRNDDQRRVIEGVARSQCDMPNGIGRECTLMPLSPLVS